MAGERALPGLGLIGYWDLGDNSWKAGMDSNLRLLSVLAGATVLSRTTSLPGSPSDGDIYIVPVGDANANDLAVRDNGAWVYISTDNGRVMYVVDETVHYRLESTGWEEFKTGGAGGLVGTPGSAFLAKATGTPASGDQSFDNVALNVGTDYNSANGEYTVPKDGVYHFYGQYVISGGAANSNSYIKVDGAEVARSHSFTSSGTQNDAHSVSITLPLVQGQVVVFNTDQTVAGTGGFVNASMFGGFEVGNRLGFPALTIAEETANYVLTDNDLVGGVWKDMNLAAPGTLTVNTGLTGTEPVVIENTGAGQITIVAGAGVTINSADSAMKLRVQSSTAVLTPKGSNVYTLAGDIEA